MPAQEVISLRLPRHAPKAAFGFDREFPVDEAVRRSLELRDRIGITRVGETTRLDRTGIPTFCVVVPDSPDELSIYNGKGVTREASMVSGIMEAAERQCAAHCRIPSRMVSPDRIVRGVDLTACGLRESYAGVEMPFVDAYDVLNEEPVEVPKALVQIPWNGVAAFALAHTNGLACGFTLTEAIHHALFELVERHLWAVTHARAHLRPKRILTKVLGEAEYGYVDDPVCEIVQPTGCERVDSLCEKFAAAGLRLRLIAMQSDGFPSAVLASVYDGTAERERLQVGFGCAWSPPEAAVRALTEAAQARVADIQAARENILRWNDPPSRFGSHTRRRENLPRGRWYFDGPAYSIDLAQMDDRSSDDLADELRRLIVAASRVASRIAVVDLSPSDRAFCAVRVIVPELESTLIDGRLGRVGQAIVDAAS